ncbi:aminotransferase class V-fold PLP-dependent enzyme [Achromobacter sp. LC458]|uniref:aminotransferase class V-fold PLP-dependent enzyme n=1 Tax=unclassified Achromobacter TaxID=2626865 RepID=UPI000629E322|nr:MULTISPECIES: aminotransferase class V-fold PLP-dependent enzyme [unclassified Achromobacter]AYD65465.1 aminotransferase class V-fold PLP-dependent enzyme [Achromobacter sp. B7]TRM50260.1 aminotransferase class V-fold PLP-dependent enzyme [Achromobacter sp. LC458]
MTTLTASATAGASNTASPLQQFQDSLASPDIAAQLADGLIGKDAFVDGPFGRKPLVYADYVASGRALMQVERFVMEQVLPYYANSHTEASYCGGFITRLRREARAAVARCCGATDAHAVIFAGSGATAGINRLVHLFGVHAAVAAGKPVRVIIGPYEHHSNILPWRECGAQIVEVAEAAEGGPDLAALDAALNAPAGTLLICALSAASNVTGIVADVAGITRRVKQAGAKMLWDYAGGAPYLPVRMSPAPNAHIDAIVFSPHKFIGGPGASGVLIVRRDAVIDTTPTWPGGGTVKFVSPEGHDYSASLESREEAGTPNVVGDIRAALVLLVKEALGADFMRERNAHFVQRALAAWQGAEPLELLGSLTAERLPIFSFRVRDGKGGYVHQQLVTRMLSDRFGIQARGGCACAGPYVHRLLDIGPAQSRQMRQAILDGREIEKPGFIRLNFSVLLPDAKADFILESVLALAADATQFESRYGFDPSRAIFYPQSVEMEMTI